MFKRIIALLIVFAIIFSLFCFPSSASVIESPSFWEWAASLTDENNPMYSFVRKFFQAVGDEHCHDNCPRGPGGKHLWGAHPLSPFEGKLYCIWCNQEIDDVINFNDAQKDYLHDSGLDNGIAVTPSDGENPSGLILYPSFSDFDRITSSTDFWRLFLRYC